MSDDECDYMSDTFLNSLAGGSNDVRPGLILTRTDQRNFDKLKEKRKLEEEKKQKAVKKKSHTENLKKSLEKPLPPDNKGFSLLQKMGFNPGSGLGKSGEGCKEPVPIEVKADRCGLGRKTVLREIAEMKKTLINEKNKKNEVTAENFVNRLREKMTERATEADFYKSQRMCFDLDTKLGVAVPDELWFWPARELEEKGKKKSAVRKKPDDVEIPGELDDETALLHLEAAWEVEEDQESSDEAEPGIEFTTPEKLQIITLYLRRTHYYCLWCGTQFEDEKDLLKDCPGGTRDDH